MHMEVFFLPEQKIIREIGNMRTSKNFSIGELQFLQTTIQEKTGYYFKNKCLLKQAFTRRSYTAQYGGENSEILELIGDSVLNYYVLKIIAERNCRIKTNQEAMFDGDCEYAFRGKESDFTALKNDLVCNAFLASQIDQWGLLPFLIVGKSDLCNHVDEQEKVKADLFESILGAIAVSVKYDPGILQTAVSKMLSIDQHLIEYSEKQYRPEYCSVDNAICTLKELAEHGECDMPMYEFFSPEHLGYDEKGNPYWACKCMMPDWGIIKQVKGHSKKDVKKYAAYLVLCQRFVLPNEYSLDGDNRLNFHTWNLENGVLTAEALL